MCDINPFNLFTGELRKCGKKGCPLNDEIKIPEGVLVDLANRYGIGNYGLNDAIQVVARWMRSNERNRIIKIIEDEQAFLTAGDKALLIERILGLDTK